MSRSSFPWVDRENIGMCVDQYELTMAQAYLDEKMTESASFELFFRRLPPHRNYLIACGIEDLLGVLENIRFTDEALAYLRRLETFSDKFIDWLANFRFSGEVRGIPEGTPVFPNEPLVEISGELPQVQLVETITLNQVVFPTLVASKAARIKQAAMGRSVVDFSLRRTHGAEAGLKVARSSFVAGVDGTSNVLAGMTFDIPVSGTMAHSYIQAHDSESQAFKAFGRIFPDTTLLVDTYDTMKGIENVIRLVCQEGLKVGAVRLDSGDLSALSRSARNKLDEVGLQHIRIFASGGLDEYTIDHLAAEEAPIDGFGVGTDMGVCKDTPSLDAAYKLVAYKGQDRMKLSTAKVTLPGRKDVFRTYEDSTMRLDTIGVLGERLSGKPLLRTFMRRGVRVSPAQPLPLIQEYCRDQLATLPPALLQLDKAAYTYPVRTSDQLDEKQRTLSTRLLRNL